jgi:hypothetical protein
MAEGFQQNRQIFLEPHFDRYLEKKLEQTYEIVVPKQSRALGKLCVLKEKNHEDSRNLQPGLIRQAKGRRNHC